MIPTQNHHIMPALSNQDAEIQRLREENRKLKKALTDIHQSATSISEYPDQVIDALIYIIAKSRDALREVEK